MRKPGVDILPFFFFLEKDSPLRVHKLKDDDDKPTIPVEKFLDFLSRKAAYFKELLGQNSLCWMNPPDWKLSPGKQLFAFDYLLSTNWAKDFFAHLIANCRKYQVSLLHVDFSDPLVWEGQVVSNLAKNKAVFVFEPLNTHNYARSRNSSTARTA